MSMQSRDIKHTDAGEVLFNTNVQNVVLVHYTVVVETILALLFGL